MTNTNHFEAIESEITRLKKHEAELAHSVERMTKEHEEAIDSLCVELLTVLDAFDRADTRMSELFPNNEDINRARKRFSTPKNKLLDILQRHQVQEITFPDGKATTEDCKIIDTAPNLEKENDMIISIEKCGYRRCGRLLRSAEVIIVKN